MHLIMLLTVLTIAWGLRLIPINTQGDWEARWQRSLFCFLCPPLLIVTTVFAILFMGAQGEMLGFKASGFSYWLCVLFALSLGLHLCKLIYQAWLSRQKIATYPQQSINKQKFSLIEIDLPYIAQIGFWQPQLVISRGLLNLLNRESLEAVLAHEQAHLYYRDTFYFFWLGWLRDCTSWLPNTESLWQEILLLREIRADLEAAKTVDPLTLAESLLTVTRSTAQPSFCFEAGFSLPLPTNCLSQRIDALVSNATLPQSPNIIYWSWLLLLLLPWGTIPFHC